MQQKAEAAEVWVGCVIEDTVLLGEPEKERERERERDRERQRERERERKRERERNSGRFVIYT